MAAVAHHHRPTLKQTNKPFKSKHATKSALKDQAKGKVSRQSPKAARTQSNAAQLRANRKNNAKITQIKKRQELVASMRIFNGVDGAPRVVAVIPLSEDVDSRAASHAFVESLDASVEPQTKYGTWKVKAERFKTSIQFINLPYRYMYAALDACKVADYVLFVLSPLVEVDKWGDMLLRALQAQGLPYVVTCVASGSESDIKTRSGIQRSLLSFMQYFVPSITRVFDLSIPSDRANGLRSICEGRSSEVRWRTGRPWLLAEEVSWNASGEQSQVESSRHGNLFITGIIRGAPFSANRLVHLPGYGDFQVERVVSAAFPLSAGRSANVDMEIEPSVLSQPDPDGADSLVSTNVLDDFLNEQTWPTESELQGAVGLHQERIPDAKKGTTPRRVKKVPKGWSDYQAAWIVESDDDDEDEDEDAGGDEEEMVLGEEPEEREANEVEDFKDVISSNDKDVVFEDLDMEEETRQLDAWRSRDRSQEEAEDAAFPDEIDTPKDIPSRERFQRYRGLRSFRTSPWDPYENLPRDYGRIFQFEDYRRTERNVHRRTEAEDYGIEPGTRVTVTLKNVPEEASNANSHMPLTLFGLLQHEHKVSVLNFSVQRNTEYDVPVRSKDPLILCCGPRRISVNPIYSQLTRGGGKGANNLHKFERWLRHGVTSVATTFGPITFGNQPCSLLRETDDPQGPELVATGSFLNTDTTRIIAKRIILTGHPFKIHKKTATVRYMFFNPDDIQYFAPVQLHTKYGRTGHIRESLGTHGYFKAHFDSPINQMDTVCMSLYKRVYPRWPALWKPPMQDARAQAQEDCTMEEYA